MTEATLWWLLTGLAVGVEMLTGTFYLLMLAMGLSAAAIAAHLGASVALQIVCAALVGGAATLLWRSYKKTQPTPPASANHDVNMDIGEIVQVDRWAADNTASVKYRGAHWRVALAAGETPVSGAYQIVDIIGSCLILKKT
jgi:membrane protein implicated in regulation of membrane protease activity